MTRIKVCGLRRPEDLRLANDLGVDFAGFIFYEKSPRHIDPCRAQQIGTRVESGGIKKVGVFVNEEIQKVRDIFACVGLDIVQLHGDETPDYCGRLGLPFWKAIRVKDERSLDLIETYDCGTFLLEPYSRDRYGGTGTSFSPEVAERAIKSGKRIIIAGGVSVYNVEQALALSPFAVDLNSSIEDRPGEKSSRKMREIVEKIRRFEVKP
jgi:phosphoribosylanthranilate isomerase